DRILKGVVLNFLDSLKQSDRLQSVPFVHRTSLFSDLVTRNARADSFHVNHLICSVRHLSGNAISDLTYGIPVLKRKFPASIIDTTGILYRLTLTKRRRKWQLKEDILCLLIEQFGVKFQQTIEQASFKSKIDRFLCLPCQQWIRRSGCGNT